MMGARPLLPQWRLQAMFVVVTMLCVMFGLWGHLGRLSSRRTAAIQRLYEEGGQGIFHRKGPKWLVPILGDNYYVRCVGISIVGTVSRPTMHEILECFPNAERVHFRNCVFSSDDLAAVSRLRNVNWFCADYCDLTDEQLEGFPELPMLEELSLKSNKLRGVGIVRLDNLPSLRYLHIGGNPIDETFVSAIRASPNLQRVRIFGIPPQYEQQIRNVVTCFNDVAIESPAAIE